MVTNAPHSLLLLVAPFLLTYPGVYRRLCEVFHNIRTEGGRTPRITFMVNTKAGETAQRIHDDLYQPGLSLGFQWIDNSRKPGAIMDVYQSGDVAPEGRFMYRYIAK